MNRPMNEETEGVIKYHLVHQHKPLPATIDIEPLSSCRQAMVAEGLIGQHPERYGGLGFGNVSARLHGGSSFIITGSQTGHLSALGRQHIALVSNYQRATYTLTSQGQVKPSSEASTHGFLYSLSTNINAVIHVHSPQLWQFAIHLGLPATSEKVPYGSGELLNEIDTMWQHGAFLHCPVLVMLGHEDGIICFGDSLQDATSELLALWQQCHAGPGSYSEV